jgi:hypothetical protein
MQKDIKPISSKFQSHMQSPVGTITENASLLVVLRPKDTIRAPSLDMYTVFIESPQARARNEPNLELPKGALNASGDMTGPIMERMSEELTLKPHKDNLINLTSLMMQHPHCRQDTRPDAVIHPSYIDPHKPVILWERRLDKKEIESLKGRFGDRRAPDEKSNIRVLDFEDLWKEGSRSPELLAAWAMYRNLRMKGYIYTD